MMEKTPQGRAVAAKYEQGAMDLGPKEPAAKAPLPKTLPEQIAAVRNTLTDLGTATPEQVARQFQRARALCNRFWKASPPSVRPVSWKVVGSQCRVISIAARSSSGQGAPWS
jgi:hypothetical protein